MPNVLFFSTLTILAGASGGLFGAIFIALAIFLTITKEVS